MSTAPAPRRTLFDIEREKRWRIWLLFALLLTMVFGSAWVVCLIVTISVYVSFPVVDTVSWVFTLRGIGVVLGVSVAGSVLYWFSAQAGARTRLLRAMHCEALDPGDRYHQRLANIVEEMRIATGAPKVECVTVRTLGLNAFAFSDLKGGGVVGVTEGALARLSRPQLEGVVAHEFGHVLSGTYVTETVSCLLFGIYSTLGEQLEQAAVGSGSARAVPLAVGAVLLRGWLWLLQVASTVTSAALSRERERQADLAAARYTRDPVSLAEALRIISRHPGGTGYIPEGLASLCIRDTARGTRGFPARWSNTHPPIQERIDALLLLAAVSPDEFEEQAGAASEDFAQREHWAPPPQAGGAGRHIGVDWPAPGASALGAAAAAAALATGTGQTGQGGSAAPGHTATAHGPGSGSAAPVPPAWGPAAVPAGGAASCPSCGASLSPADYEGLSILVCRACGGRLLAPADVSKILARREVAFTEEQVRIADLIAASGDQLRRAARIARGGGGAPLTPCPVCGKAMIRRHYSYEHAVEVDYCSICDLYWFEKDELEALQVLAERQAG